MSRERLEPTAYSDSHVCPSCGRFVARINQDTGWCYECSPNIIKKLDEWLEAHADHLEHYILQGYTLNQAVKQVAKDNRPVCAICSKPMQRASKGSVICRRTVACRTAARRYTYLYQTKDLTKAQALAQVLEEFTS